MPGVLAGIALAEHLRHRRLRWTWVLLGLPLVLPSLVLLPQAEHRLRALEHPTAAGIALAGALPWIWATLPTAVVFKVWRDRRDRLHGGAAEARLANEIGPLEHRRLKRQPSNDHALLLGRDARGARVTVPPLKAHATIVGGSNTGKTSTATVLLEQHVVRGAGFVILDGKGGRDLPRAAVQLAQAHHRRVVLWSITPYGDPQLDRHRAPWNPVGEGTPTEVKDRIASAEEQAEPYYRAVASRGLLIAATTRHAQNDVPLTLAKLAESLDDPAAFAQAVKDKVDRKWMSSLTDSERSAVRGLATRLRTMVASDGGPALTPGDTGLELRVRESIVNKDLVVMTLPEGSYPELVPHVARYALQAITSACTHIEQSGTPADALVFVDELSAFDGDQLSSGFERGRSAGVRFIVATQSLSNLATAGGDKLLHAALDNAELLIIHRQVVPDAVELLASIGGTEEAWEHTHKVRDQLAGPLGLDETGDRARRLTDRFRAHPNTIKQLGLGEAIIIAHRPTTTVRRVNVTPPPGPDAHHQREHGGAIPPPHR